MTEIEAYLRSCGNHTVIADLVEVESGKDDQNRPVLQQALELASQSGAVVLVSRLCRLSRDLEFVAGLMKSKVGFRIATNPTADELTIGIYAVMGMHERKEISRRTKQALAAAKKRGVKLGTAGSRNIKKANEAKILAAARFAQTLQPMIEPLRASGMSFQKIADALNGMGIKTQQGKCFFPSTVSRYAAMFG